ncbi:tetrahydrocannabinolic acid synthase-like [Momordica charantia]|uniref:Tetrahydrocannabinolic acid synthase-like n=1 Tax=Momordica charantia TaxID=3673 RepID=A0A6J1DG89_MOMCH|nr:tetrahydrocannabinolic acid synthase-like [Momordica charantia]
MKYSPLIILSLAFILLSSSSSWAVACAEKHESFLQCLFHHSSNSSSISKVIYSPINSSYSSVLNSSVQNFRFLTAKTPKPLFIITPSHLSHIQIAVICSKTHGFQIRTRSDGHDTEGLSYVAYVPFIIIDLINLRSVTINVEHSTAWVQSGATLGELYYSIAQKSQTLAFPAGVCPTVGVGGHSSGGGYGLMLRKYGFAADNVIDAYLIDANGKFHDRESMGEDLFWAIRGGGGGSLGIVVAWKVKLVPVPATVTICLTNRNLDEDLVKLIHRWQFVAPKLDENLYVGIMLNGGNASTQGGVNPKSTFFSLFLGKIDELMAILKRDFPEMNLANNDCVETSWIESTIIAATRNKTVESLEYLLTKIPLATGSIKTKSDYVKEPIPKVAIEGIWERLKAQDIEASQLVIVPYGGRMSQILDSEIPYSHRAGYLYKIGYVVGWKEQSVDVGKRHLSWIRELYDYMTPFVSKSPRAAYVNYRDLDIGTNNKYGKTSYKRASIWGSKYFGKNFNRLVHVKSKVDPSNFFRHEQSIPPL